MVEVCGGAGDGRARLGQPFLEHTQATDYSLRLGGQAEAIGGVAERIRQVLPEFSPQEALRQAILLQAASTLRPCPRLPAPPDARDRLDALDSLLSRDDLLSQGT